MSGLVSTWMGDRLGIPGAVSFSFFFFSLFHWARTHHGVLSSAEWLEKIDPGLSLKKEKCLFPFGGAAATCCRALGPLNGPFVSGTVAYGHTTLNTPDLVRSRKLSRVGPGQYLDGRLPGNTRCCKLFMPPTRDSCFQTQQISSVYFFFSF